MNFGQVLTAMVTPFDQNGEIDFNATKTLVEHLITNGTDGLVVAGTTGESPTLTTEEKIELFKCVVEAAAGRVHVIAGTGSNNTQASMSLTKLAEETGVDGIMLVAPYYNKPSQEGLYQHFKTIAESTSLPVMLYNIPGRSIVNISVETVVRLSEITNVVSIKEASGNLDAMAEIISKTPSDFTLYSGDDGLTIPVLAIGGAGVISVASHIIGNDMQEMINAFKNGDVQKAAATHRNLLPIMRALFIAPSPSPVKAALNLNGIQVGGVRLPMVPLSNKEQSALEKVLQASGINATC
ncbi:4-hydroxy-tetrahydrodipicolinate synthase [Priestia megaterium]|jgi:4-hydroxy-tetrahydrodipicolinate synthase|uniref:4-hydroxy-tetrahydrodipicolinate synthase n=1 Tax=Priestia megaterium (strain ATCC 14581 / DSM 32 / CCUG 1817 / JCM 2506 / NBRC 15308 / NCIMB 9376 / NCTC 10342 / NRRL B-14308 / VKM B-512 / Ford 19) TaxID=1348623 RepID=A0A0B6AE37_PRIM2|nr:4-hydroxy-tetrahydrodipicolinate synthase [Priestia megaterium]AJI21776.1 4-hydroxy-tetrahydrodipicolinate synthase [Priestia megaterium NBRC 15308 = ATCC 14581]KFM97787.1 dihydrodipicolinate synthase [Priestia megaterium]KGJ78445.1 dihydrodipicolinate synthase [Priestia megaterium NBRC 15308 = ATCC 14581]MBU8753805.1 4-hydroxy-tetrahydrodipicolinate synthase [Priestia megaterium]MDR4232640.1 4-hydroxy-tetrahydrodipicolinate synthase [Priestia megaterium]